MKRYTEMTLTEKMQYAIDNGPHGLELIDAVAVSIEKRRTLVDADCDYNEWGDRYYVRFIGTHGSFDLGWHETHAGAKAAIAERAACKVTQWTGAGS